METKETIFSPTKSEQNAAFDSYSILSKILSNYGSEFAEIKIDTNNAGIKVPQKALLIFRDILKEMSEGNGISISPIVKQISTQKAAEILGCSRPHLVQLLEDGKIDFVKVGKHRRIILADVLKFKQTLKSQQKKLLIELMQADEASDLYEE